MKKLINLLDKHTLSFKVYLVEGVEKWEDRKNFNFPYFCLVESEKVKG